MVWSDFEVLFMGAPQSWAHCAFGPATPLILCLLCWQVSGDPCCVWEGVTRESGLRNHCGCPYKDRKMQKFRPWGLYIFDNMLWFRCSYYGRIYFGGLKLYCKKSFLCFPCPQILWCGKLFYLYVPTTAKSQCKFSWNLSFHKQFIEFRSSFGSLTDSHLVNLFCSLKFSILPVFNLTCLH